ncbi:P-II family nitrogen regulator [uncultured Methanobacterium sp.]|uniref:P-II family nitrogen regulator n=1 Tax=uncultured Methanobacterium sp. TaxID=176306 RepID=UPI002AA79316|nr:P-II family nitrogen regulator [uncultured Methanobacterium sp.]
MENETQSNDKKIVILCNYNSTKDHSETIIDYFNDNITPDKNIELSVINYRRILIDGGKNYLFNPPGYAEFMSIKQVLSEEVDGVIVFIETSIGIFETDLEIINLIASENIPHVLFANRDDFSEFEMDTHVEGVLSIPTIAQDGIGINDGLKMLLKLINKYEKEKSSIKNSAIENQKAETAFQETTKSEETTEIHESQENYYETEEPYETLETYESEEIYEESSDHDSSPSFESEFYKLRFFFHPIELDNVKNSLAKFGFSNITTIDIKYQNYGTEKMETYRCSSYELELPPKIEMMMVIKKEEIEYVIQALEAVKTEDISEKLFISPVEDVIRISTSERGENAVD